MYSKSLIIFAISALAMAQAATDHDSSAPTPVEDYTEEVEQSPVELEEETIEEDVDIPSYDYPHANETEPVHNNETNATVLDEGSDAENSAMSLKSGVAAGAIAAAAFGALMF
jgi:hypothetical protein